MRDEDRMTTRCGCPQGTSIDPSARLYNADMIKIGKGCYIGPLVIISGNVTIEDDARIEARATLVAHMPMRIGRATKIGYGSIIIAETTPVDIAEFTEVMPGSVLQNISKTEHHEIWAGNPARHT
jgi:acetyltransferase-like isoleucine patch superfamily enzyme